MVVPPFEFHQDLWRQKARASLSLYSVICANLYTFSRFGRTQACVRQTDWQTDGRTDGRTNTRRQHIPC